MAGDPRVFGSHWAEDEEPHFRLLFCKVCKTMEELPDYHGNPVADFVLNEALVKHGSLTENPHVGGMLHLSLAMWEDTRIKRATVEGLWKDEKGFKPSYYDIKNTFIDDAAKCFSAHHRAVPCLDWHDSSKRFASPAAKDRRLLAREMHDERIANTATTEVYLCDFCPVAADVSRRKFDEAVRKGLA